MQSHKNTINNLLKDFTGGPLVFLKDDLAEDPRIDSINISAGVDSLRHGVNFLSPT